MTFLEAALQILRSSHRPLTTQEITERALQQGLIDTQGKTPIKTMSAALYLAVRNDGELVKIHDPGPQRARWRSVRWTTRQTRQKA